MKAKIFYGAAAVTLICLLSLHRGTLLRADIFYGNKAETEYGKSGIQKKVEKRIFTEGAPGGISASDGTSTNIITITWDQFRNAETYYICRSTAPDGNYTILADTASLSYQDKTPLKNITYYYKVMAGSSVFGKSKMSSYNTGYLGMAIPSGVSASDGAFSNTIQVTWNNVAGAESYYVYRSASQSGSYYDIGNTTSLSYNDPVSRGMIYYYRVKSHSAVFGYSRYSDSDGGYIDYLRPYMLPEMMPIPAVTSFSMGRPDWEVSSNLYEKPVHPVNLNAFSLSRFEITVQQYTYFLNAGSQDSYYIPDMADTVHCGIIKRSDGDYSNVISRAQYPVVYVNWNFANAYCSWLTAKAGSTFLLPTEAQWEYTAAGNAGHMTYPWGNTWTNTNCNWGENGAYDHYVYSAPVGQYSSGTNMFGVYDMAGNVHEWCRDYFLTNYYSVSATNNPECADNTSGLKVFRGGAWSCTNRDDFRSSRRFNGYDPASSANNIGFRIVK
ncbi:MAG: SUMF1/EgtB/PvdO family nonheme iron enzyme [bacterium]|nr:SUMF1/EgtB/PvdO family nonheme iron enzyme [bacterium]